MKFNFPTLLSRARACRKKNWCPVSHWQQTHRFMCRQTELLEQRRSSISYWDRTPSLCSLNEWITVFTFWVQLHVDKVSHNRCVVERLNSWFGSFHALKNNFSNPQVLLVLRIVQDLHLLDDPELLAHVRKKSFPDIVVQSGKCHLLGRHRTNIKLIDLEKGGERVSVSVWQIMWTQWRWLTCQQKHQHQQKDQRWIRGVCVSPLTGFMLLRSHFHSVSHTWLAWEGGCVCNFLTAPLSIVALSVYLKFRHRKIRFFILCPKTTDPRVPDDVHRWNPGVLWVKRRGNTQLLSIQVATSQQTNLLQSGNRV